MSSYPPSPSPHSPVPKKSHDLFPAPHWRDLWAALLFYFHLAVFAIITVYCFVNSKHELADAEWLRNINLGSDYWTLIVLQVMGSVIIGLAVSYFSLNMMSKNAEQLMNLAMISAAVLFFLYAVLIISINIFMGIIMFLGGALSLIWYLMVRSRIPFSAIILRMVIDCTREYPSVYFVMAMSIFVTIIYSVVFMICQVVIAKAYEFLGEELFKVVAIYSVFSMFWTTQVIVNVVHTAIAGVFATYYFTDGSNQLVTQATSQSVKRALSYSFGSVCFGSLIVALIQTLRFVLRSAHNGRNNLAKAIIDCVLDIIEGLVRYFNYYAYTQIAIYGKSFVEAASDTWELIKRRGLEAIINDDLIGACCGFICVFAMVLSMAFSTGVSVFIYNVPFFTALIVSILFSLIALMITASTMKVITAGSTSIFVCLAEDPRALQRNNPTLYGTITTKYGAFLA